MQPFLTHKQFDFSPRQRELMLQLAKLAKEGLQERRQDTIDKEEDSYSTPLLALDQLVQELAKFSYHIGDEQYRKISLSTPVLMLLLFELMKELNPVRETPALGREAEEDELLRLHFFLSFDYLYHYTTQEYSDFIDQFRPAEHVERQQRYAHHYINTAGMDEAAVFTALYNAAKPQGRGFDQDDVRDISVAEGAQLMEAPDQADFEQTSFDYVNGRRMKISREDIERGYIDVTAFDEGNGAGAAQNAVKHLPRI